MAKYMLRAAYLAIIVFTERLIVHFTLITFVLMGNNLTADVTYEMSTYFNILQLVVALYVLGGSIYSFGFWRLKCFFFKANLFFKLVFWILAFKNRANIWIHLIFSARANTAGWINSVIQPIGGILVCYHIIF